MKGIGLFLGIALLLGGVFSLFSSRAPDGLEAVAQALGWADQAAKTPIMPAPLPDYALPWWRSSPLSTSLAGILGVLLCFILPYGLFLLRKK